jgi:hypothetical protein
MPVTKDLQGDAFALPSKISIRDLRVDGQRRYQHRSVFESAQCEDVNVTMHAVPAHNSQSHANRSIAGRDPWVELGGGPAA